jgi:hypothetical protein
VGSVLSVVNLLIIFFVGAPNLFCFKTKDLVICSLNKCPEEWECSERNRLLPHSSAEKNPANDRFLPDLHQYGEMNHTSD